MFNCWLIVVPPKLIVVPGGKNLVPHAADECLLVLVACFNLAWLLLVASDCFWFILSAPGRCWLLPVLVNSLCLLFPVYGGP